MKPDKPSTHETAFALEKRLHAGMVCVGSIGEVVLIISVCDGDVTYSWQENGETRSHTKPASSFCVRYKSMIRPYALLQAGLPPFHPTPSSMWLVIVECVFQVVYVSPCGEGFFIPGQEPCWGLDHVDTWVREIIPTNAERRACDCEE